MKNEEVSGIEQAAHEKLCAYVFGELQGEERAAFERELLQSPALQAERARLEATIGLVKRAIPDEGLSARVRSDVVAAARRSRFRILSGRSLALVAAALLALVGGAVGLRVLGGELPGRANLLDGGRVATAPAPTSLVKRNLANQPAADMRGRAAEAEKAEALRELGYAGDDSSGDVSEQLDALGYGGGDSGVSIVDLEGFGTSTGDPAYGASSSALVPPLEVAQAQFTGGAAAAPAAGEPGVYSLTTGSGPGLVNLLPASEAPPESTSGATGLAGGAGGKFGDRFGGRKNVKAARAAVNPQAYRSTGEVQDLARSLERVARGVEEEPQVIAGHPVQITGVIDTTSESSGFKLGFYEGYTIQEENRRQPITSEQATAIAEELLAVARLQPGESPRDMFFRYFGDGPFVLASEEKISTFAVDVDTASYALMRAYLNQGVLPPRESVRTEEFVNYFKADQPAPTSGDPFAIGLELAPSLFATDPRTEILRVTVRGRDVADFQRQPAALTFVIDNSGSMEEGGRLELVKRALSLLLRELYAADSVAVVKFSNQASVVTEPLPASRRGELESLIQALPIEGGTNVEAGLRLGFERAAANLARNAVNRVILCSDGVGNIGETDARALLELVKESRAKGIYLNTVGVGMGNHNDAFLEELADKGDGVCNYVDSDAEAKRVFVDGLAKAIQPIARDVKIQVELDAAQVESWRLLGYENRALRNQDFKDDKIDAGEVNAGHQVTALYELVRNPRPGTVATVRVRYKPPFAIDRGDEGSRAKAEAEQALEIERSLDGSSVRPGFAAASGGFRRSVLVAQLAEVLRQSVHARGDSFARLIEEAKRLEGELGDPDFTEFVKLLGQANPLLDERAKEETPRVQELLDRLAQLHYEQGREERKRELEAQAGEKKDAETRLEERLGVLRDELSERDAELRAEREAEGFAKRRAEIERLEQEVRELVQREVAPEVENRRER